MSKPMRQAMPATAAFIDAMSAAFGAEMIDGQIKRGMAGDAFAFHAIENGREVGTAFPPADGVKLSETLVGPMNPKPEKENRRG